MSVVPFFTDYSKLSRRRQVFHHSENEDFPSVSIDFLQMAVLPVEPCNQDQPNPPLPPPAFTQFKTSKFLSSLNPLLSPPHHFLPLIPVLFPFHLSHSLLFRTTGPQLCSHTPRRGTLSTPQACGSFLCSVCTTIFHFGLTYSSLQWHSHQKQMYWTVPCVLHVRHSADMAYICNEYPSDFTTCSLQVEEIGVELFIDSLTANHYNNIKTH